MHMIDVMAKLKEIADSGYDNEDIQRGIAAAEGQYGKKKKKYEATKFPMPQPGDEDGKGREFPMPGGVRDPGFDPRWPYDKDEDPKLPKVRDPGFDPRWPYDKDEDPKLPKVRDPGFDPRWPYDKDEDPKLPKVRDPGFDPRWPYPPKKYIEQNPGGDPVHPTNDLYRKAGLDEGEEILESKMICKHCGDEIYKPKSDCHCDCNDPHGDHWLMMENEEAGVEEVHEEVGQDYDDLSDILKLAGQSGVLGMKTPQTLVVEDIEMEEDMDLGPGKKEKMDWGPGKKEKDWGDPVPHDWMHPDDIASMGRRIVEPSGRIRFVHDDPKDKPKKEAVEEEHVEEDTVAVPVSELQDLMRLAGYENYETKVEEYANEPEPEYMDTEDQMIGLSGGMNGPKKMYPAAAGADNPMDQEPREVEESDDTGFDNFYEKYDAFVESLRD